MIRKLTYCTFFILLFSSVIGQHTALLSQYQLNAYPSNPAFTGSQDALSISTSYRNQWMGFPGAPITNTIAAHTPLKNENIAVGILFYRDVIAKHFDNGLFASYAYRIKTDKWRLSLGINAGAAFKQSRLSEAVVVDLGDEVYDQNTPLSILPNFSFGAYLNNKRFFLGVSTPFIMTPKLDEGKWKFKSTHDFSQYNMVSTGGISFKLGKTMYLKPSLVYRLHFSSGGQMEYCVAADYSDLFGIGLSYRTKDAVIAMLKVNINKQLLLGYSVDFTVSDLNNYNNGTHEVFLRYNFKYESNSISPRFL